VNEDKPPVFKNVTKDNISSLQDKDLVFWFEQVKLTEKTMDLEIEIFGDVSSSIDLVPRGSSRTRFQINGYAFPTQGTQPLNSYGDHEGWYLRCVQHEGAEQKYVKRVLSNTSEKGLGTYAGDNSRMVLRKGLCTGARLDILGFNLGLDKMMIPGFFSSTRVEQTLNCRLEIKERKFNPPTRSLKSLTTGLESSQSEDEEYAPGDRVLSKERDKILAAGLLKGEEMKELLGIIQLFTESTHLN